MSPAHLPGCTCPQPCQWHPSTAASHVPWEADYANTVAAGNARIDPLRAFKAKVAALLRTIEWKGDAGDYSYGASACPACDEEREQHHSGCPLVGLLRECET